MFLDSCQLRFAVFAAAVVICAAAVEANGEAECPAGENVESVDYWIKRFPPESESLLVIQGEYSVAAKGAAALSTVDGLYESYLQGMFGEQSRNALEGKTLIRWIVAASNFRSPEWPLEILDRPMTGWSPKYDGCHVLIFDSKSAPCWNDVVGAIMGDLQASSVLIGNVLVFESRHSVSRRHRLSIETPELAKRIDEALTTRYWMTAFAPNVYVVGTSDKILNRLLQAPTVHGTPFPESMSEWAFIDQSAPVWGVRCHPHRSAIPHNLARFVPSAADKTVGVSFTADPSHGRVVMAFESLDGASNQIWKNAIPIPVDKVRTLSTESSTAIMSVECGLTVEPDANERAILLAWLLAVLGHSTMI